MTLPDFHIYTYAPDTPISDGWLLCYKRLTGNGRFQWPRNEQEAKQLSPQQFRWLMEGLSVEQKKRISPLKPELY